MSSSQLALSTSSIASLASSTPVTTRAPLLSCRGNSTILTTTDCTYGFTTSYCHSAQPALTCSDGDFPSIYMPVRCITISTCYPLPTTTASCINGFTAYATHTAFDGLLSNNQSTRVESPQCNCGGYVSWNYKPYASYCLPTTSCGDFLTTTSSVASYLANGSTVTSERTYCNCPGNQTRE